MSKVGKRSNPGKDLLEFVIGMVMLSVGLFWLSNVINVNIGLFGGGMMMGDFNVSSGAIFVPFIVAVIWIFIKPNIWAKIFLALSIIDHYSDYHVSSYRICFNETLGMADFTCSYVRWCWPCGKADFPGWQDIQIYGRKYK